MSKKVDRLSDGALTAIVNTWGKCVGAAAPSYWDDIEGGSRHTGGQRDRTEKDRYARKACLGCPVSPECAELTLRVEAKTGECHNIAGAMSPERRRKELRDRGWVRSPQWRRASA